MAQYNPTKSLGAVSVGPMKLWNTEPPSLMSDGDAMDARLDAAALASKEAGPFTGSSANPALKGSLSEEVRWLAPRSVPPAPTF